MISNLGEMLAHRACLAATHDGFVGADSCYNYGEVNQRCDRLGSWLVQAGVKPGDRVAVYGKNTEALVKS